MYLFNIRTFKGLFANKAPSNIDKHVYEKSRYQQPFCKLPQPPRAICALPGGLPGNVSDACTHTLIRGYRKLLFDIVFLQKLLNIMAWCHFAGGRPHAIQ